MKTFDAGKTRMIKLRYGKKNFDNNVKPFSSETLALRTDRQTEKMLYQYRASMC